MLRTEVEDGGDGIRSHDVEGDDQIEVAGESGVEQVVTVLGDGHDPDTDIQQPSGYRRVADVLGKGPVVFGLTRGPHQTVQRRFDVDDIQLPNLQCVELGSSAPVRTHGESSAACSLSSGSDEGSGEYEPTSRWFVLPRKRMAARRNWIVVGHAWSCG